MVKMREKKVEKICIVGQKKKKDRECGPAWKLYDQKMMSKQNVSW